MIGWTGTIPSQYQRKLEEFHSVRILGSGVRREQRKRVTIKMSEWRKGEGRGGKGTIELDNFGGKKCGLCVDVVLFRGADRRTSDRRTVGPVGRDARARRMKRKHMLTTEGWTDGTNYRTNERNERTTNDGTNERRNARTTRRRDRPARPR